MKLKTYLPITNWLPTYKRAQLSGDLSAGVTVGVMLIPQGMAYAMIAGLPPVYGLYAALIPQLMYALFGTSRQLAVGPVAMDSLLVAAGLSTLAIQGTENYIALALLLSFMVGSIQLIFGLLKMGFLVNFLSKPIISGFTIAAALIIGINQLRHVLGVSLPVQNHPIELFYHTLLNLPQIHWPTFIIAIAGILLMVGLKKIHRSIPSALVVVALSILVVQFGNLETRGVQIIGTIPSGLPSFALPFHTLDMIYELLPIAFTVAMVAFMESIAVAKSIQAKHADTYQINNNQELVGLGISNMAGSFFGAYPTAGGFGRSAVNNEAGAQTNMANIISAALVAMTLLFFTELFFYLPKAILGAIILVAVTKLIDMDYLKYLWRSSKEDFLLLSLTFLITLIWGVKAGITGGVLCALLALIRRTAYPHIAVLGRLASTDDYRNVRRFKQTEQDPAVLIIRQDAAMHFANIAIFTATLQEEILKKGVPLKLIILHCGSIPHIDTTALQSLELLVTSMKKQQIAVYFTHVIGPVRDLFVKSNFLHNIGEDHFFSDVTTAVDYFYQQHKTRNPAKLQIAMQSNVWPEK